MNKSILILLIFQLFSFSFNQDGKAYLQISKTKSENEITGSLTPLVVQLSSEDKNEKIKGVDLICVVDTSISMDGDEIDLVKESLKYLVKLMNSNDKLAIVSFTLEADTNLELTEMTKEGKDKANNAIDQLTAHGGTRILTGLKEALKIFTDDYTSGDRIASMILLSDGDDWDGNVDTNFENHIKEEGKENYIFTLHTIGYGVYHNASMMRDISLIRDGGYFFIRHLSEVNSAILEIYGSLSTNFKVNVLLSITSKYKIKEVMGMDDMYKNNLIDTSNTFTTKILHFVYGKIYDFIVLVDIPQNIQNRELVLTARATANQFDLKAEYLWDNSLDPFAQEKYIRGISSANFQKAFTLKDAGDDIKSKDILKEGKKWVANYDTFHDWKKEYDDAINDLDNFSKYGKANLLSKIRELKSSKPGIHYQDENSYQRKIIDDSFNIDITNWNHNDINEEVKITKSDKNNYIYFYLTNGTGEIYGKHFSGNHSSFVLYSKDTEEITIRPKSSSMQFYYNEQNLERIQTKIDFSTGGKFAFKKDFPFEFYTAIDGKKDVTFTIQFLKLEYEEIEKADHLIDIKAYVLDSRKIENLKLKPRTKPDDSCFQGYFDQGHRIGKIVIKKEELKDNLNSNLQNYLYIIVSKSSNSRLVYTNVEGQYTFVPMDYTYTFVPESFYIFSNLYPGQKSPHLYAIQLEQELGKKTRIEFASSGNELDCAILKYNNSILNSDE